MEGELRVCVCRGGGGVACLKGRCIVVMLLYCTWYMFILEHGSSQRSASKAVVGWWRVTL
jgi:hypothetical protein